MYNWKKKQSNIVKSIFLACDTHLIFILFKINAFYDSLVIWVDDRREFQETLCIKIQYHAIKEKFVHLSTGTCTSSHYKPDNSYNTNFYMMMVMIRN